MRAPRFSNREAGSDLAQHEPSLTPLLQDWVAGLRRLLKDTQHGCFNAKPRLDRTQRPVLQMAAVCSAILEGGALHVAAARCHAEMLIFLLVTDEDAQLNEQLRVPARKALYEQFSTTGRVRHLRLDSWDEISENLQSAEIRGSPPGARAPLALDGMTPLALALAFGAWASPLSRIRQRGARGRGPGSSFFDYWRGPESGLARRSEEEILKSLTTLIEAGAAVDVTWESARKALASVEAVKVTWEDLVKQCGHGRGVSELLIKASARGGAGVMDWLEAKERSEQAGKIIAALLEPAQGKEDAKLVLSNRHSAVEQLVAEHATDLNPQQRAKLSELVPPAPCPAQLAPTTPLQSAAHSSAGCFSGSRAGAGQGRCTRAAAPAAALPADPEAASASRRGSEHRVSNQRFELPWVAAPLCRRLGQRRYHGTAHLLASRALKPHSRCLLWQVERLLEVRATCEARPITGDTLLHVAVQARAWRGRAP